MNQYQLMDARKAHKASSSSSLSSSKRWEYQVFLSFRGEDTRKGFTSHLYKALQSRGYDVFMDEDDLQVGQVIKPELLQAIEKSKISVIVFSTRYADSSWCLDELVKIMECRRTLNQIVLPIFYDVDPSDVRKQTGTLASDFQKHTIRHKDEVVKEWRTALTEAADLCAGVLKDTADRNEAKFIEAFIENNIDGRLSTTPLPVATYPVGVDSRVHDMINYLLDGGSQDVVMIGIWGMAGLGKTTAAKAIYNRIKDKFDAHGFLGDIRDTANRCGLVYLQELLLAEICKNRTEFHITCVDGGMGVIKKKLEGKRVLVIIDDVDELDQLEAIAGNRDWFGSGSRIIITTRNKHFLEVLRVNEIFTVPEMNPDEGLKLFCRHAFQKGCPNKQYFELSKMVVSYSGGLPLALKVLGSFLIRRTIAEWESQLQELEGIPHKDILKKLRISYDGLDRNEKCIFLDISCFFIGMNKDHVIKILDGCGFNAEIKISVLLQKCLVSVNEKNQLMMHDLLRDMGRAICQEGDPEDRSRLWLHPEDVTDVLEDKSGTKKVEGLALNMRSSEKASFGTEAFSKMRKLKLLQLNYVELTGEYKFLSKNLRWLCWHGFLLDSIPGDFDLTCLIAMDLQFSKLKIVWKDCKLLEKLTIINLSHSHDLTTSPDFSKVPNLEELILECTSLSDVHESIGDLKRLALVNLEHCKKLKDLPLNLYRSKSIETLLLNGCSSFKNLAEGLGNMVSLRTLEADDTAVTKIPSSIVKLKNLRSLALCGLEWLTDFWPYLRSTGFLPPLLDGLNSLRKLALANCSLTDDELPKDLGCLSSLEHLDCGQNSFCRLPSLSGLSKLEYLCLNDCRKLRAIPELPTNLKVLRGFGCTALETMPDFSEMSGIRELYLSDSYKLTEIPGLDKSLNSMTRIHMEGCTNLTTNFRMKILQGWTSCGFGGIYLEGICGIPKWFKLVGNEYNEVDFEVPQNFSCDLKGLMLCCVYSSDNPKPKDGLCIMVKNLTQGTTLRTWPAIASVKTDSKPEDYYLWQGQLSNDKLSLQGGDKVQLSVFATVDFVRVKNAGVNLEWDKVLKENMHDSDPHLYDLNPNEAGPSQGEPLRELVPASCNLTDTAIYNHLGSLSSLVYLDLRKINVLGIPCLSGLVKLEQLCLNHCRNLRAIPDLPTNLKVLRAEGCIALEKMPDLSEMSNIRELYLRDSGKLTEIPGLDKSLNSMTKIHMEKCTNLTADFRKNILQGWTSCGYGGIFLSGNDIPDWFDCVDDDDDIVYFTVPQSGGRILKGLTLSFVYSCSSILFCGCRISIKNMTEGTDLDARIIPDCYYLWQGQLSSKRDNISISMKNMTEGTELDARIIPDCPNNGYYLWQGQLSNDELKLQDGDKVLIEIIAEYDSVKVKKTGVSLVWDKFMNENMIDYHPCAYERHQYLVSDDDIIHVKYDYYLKKSPDFSKFPNLEKLILKSCKQLIKVHPCIGDLGRLSLVNLEECEMLRDLPLNFYKSKSIETLILNGCWRFQNLADGLGDMVSLTNLEADSTAIRQIPSLAGLSKLKVLCLNACRKLRAIPDLPTNLYVLKAIDCPGLETIPDFSKMWNMRELYLSDSFKLTEVPGLDKSLNSMTRIHMEGCTNLTADFRNSILQRWTSCGIGGIYLNGIYDIPEWFKIVNHVDNIVFFEVPQRIMGRDLKGLTICFVYSSDRPKLEDSQGPIGIIVRNLTKQTALHTKIAFGSVKTSRTPEEHFFWRRQLSDDPEDHYLWQGQLSNDVLRLEGGDHVSILVRPDDVDFVRVKKTGVHLEWDKLMKENMDNPDPHLYDLETNRDF